MEGTFIFGTMEFTLKQIVKSGTRCDEILAINQGTNNYQLPDLAGSPGEKQKRIGGGLRLDYDEGMEKVETMNAKASGFSGRQ